MSSSVQIHCEHCGASLRLAAGKIRPGATAPCPKCGRTIQLAGPAPGPAAAPAAMDEIQCQVCGAMLRMRADKRPAAGMTARCPRCQSKVYIPPILARRPGPLAAVPPEEEPPTPPPSASPGARVGASGTLTLAPSADVSLDDISSPAPYPNPFRAAVSQAEEDFPMTTVADEAPEPPAVEESAAEEPAIEIPEPEEEQAPAPAVEPEEAAEEAEEEPAIEIRGDERMPVAPMIPAPSPAAKPAARPQARAGDLAVFWTVEIGGEAMHPGGVAELRLWARQGKLQPEDRVRRGDGAWQVAREVPELGSLFARPRAGAARPAPGRPPASPEARRGWMAGALGGVWTLPPVFALLVFSGEFERLVDTWKSNNSTILLYLSGGILLTGAVFGRALAALQTRYEQRGEAANMWSAGGALAVGGGGGLTCGLLALSLWPHSGAFTLLFGFVAYGVTAAFLVLISYRWLFVDRRS
jgi:DNA-directed RNA polymerase subunit RPC12/RpoP